MRLLVLVMRSVNQTYAPDRSPLSASWTAVDSTARASAADGDRHCRVGDQCGQGRRVRDDQVGVPFLRSVGCGQRHGRHAGLAARPRSGGGVLDDHAAGRVDARPAGGEQTGLGVGCAAADAAGDVVRADQDPGRDAHRVAAVYGGVGDDGPFPP
jgi:hypothetical protein